MKKFSKIASLVLTGCVGAGALGFAACKTGPDVPAGTTVINYVCSELNNSTMNTFKKLVDTYNAGQGKTDLVYVEGKYSATTYSQYGSELRNRPKYSVATVGEDQIRTLATSTAKNGFLNLNTILTDEMKEQIDLDGMPKGMVDSFRMNATVSEDGKYQVGGDSELLAIPISSDPHVLYYNTKIFSDKKINVVHVGETELESYNSANNSKLVACGYAEYKDAPYAGAVSSVNEQGLTVYKVFNDRIAMSWAEQRILARQFQKQFGYEYGYMSEWWFNYGWSVGGDCVRWNEQINNYELSLGSKESNYIADKAVKINGRNYAQGEVINFEDTLHLNQNPSEKAEVVGDLIEIASFYDAFLEFNRMGIPTNKQADAGYYGYGVAPDTTTNRNARFLTGNNCPFLVAQYSDGVNSFSNSTIGNNWDIAPMCQYREYTGEETYYNGNETFANEYLKIVGESYGDSGEFKGEVRTTANGTKVVGKVTGASLYTALAIPAKAPEGTTEAALKFILWVAGEEGQKIIGETGTVISNHPSYNMSPEYTGTTKNAYGAALVTAGSYVGDYAYFSSRTWIDNWSTLLNGDVRAGNVTLQSFLDQKLTQANNDLAAMTMHIIGR